MTLPSTPRLAAAALALALYATLCLAIWLRARASRSPPPSAAPDGDAPLLVAFASQTGQAEELARETARLLREAGQAVDLCPLDQIDPAMFHHARRVLFVVSTYGEGEPPDNAARFWSRCLAWSSPSDVDLQNIHYGVLALGDRQYTHFCGFGRAIDDWLHAHGATPLFARVEMDGGDPAALHEWLQRLERIAPVDPSSAWPATAPFSSWTLAARRHLNPGSQGTGVFLLEFTPPPGTGLPTWEPGDLAQVAPPGDSAHPRDYSIASTMEDGRLHLLVRQALRPDGTPGQASGWLTQTLPVGEAASIRLRAHAGFRIGNNAQRPLVLIGNGSGLAGLRSHLRARAVTGAGPNWLLFGERQAAHDFLCGDELRAWLAQGVLQRLDLAFSRDQAQRIHVQDRLAEAGDVLRDWVNDGAAIYVCGSLQGMAQGVDATLRSLLGDAQVEQLARDGRYRRDVY